MVRNRIMPTKAQMRKMPSLDSENMDKDDPVAHVRFFFGGRGAFYAIACDPESMLFFGYTISNNGPDCDEWGYVSLSDLEEASSSRIFGGVERDLYFSSKPLSEACKQYGEPLPYTIRCIGRC